MPVTKAEKIRTLLKEGVAVQTIAKRLKVSPNYIYQIRYKDSGAASKTVTKKTKTRSKTATKAVPLTGWTVTEDRTGFSEALKQHTATAAAPPPTVIMPTENPIWDAIEVAGLGFHAGSAIAAIAAGKLATAAEHIDREMARQNGSRAG